MSKATRTLLPGLLMIAAIAAPLMASAPAVWQEGEDFTLASDTTRDNVRPKGPASGGKCLFGPSLDKKDNVVEYRFTLDEPVADARVIFRYCRLHWRDTMVPAAMKLELIGGDPVVVTALFDDTKGWGRNQSEWRLLTVPVSDLRAGAYTLRLTSLADNNSINLDGFFIAGADFAVTTEELASMLQLSISDRGYVGLQTKSAAIDQARMPALPVAMRLFGDGGAVTGACITDAAGKTTRLKAEVDADAAWKFPLPKLPDGAYTLTIESSVTDKKIEVPLKLMGEFLATLDGRIEKLVAVNKRLATMNTPEAAICKADFAHAVEFVEAGRKTMSQSVATPVSQWRKHLAQAEGLSDPTPLAVNIAATLTQYEQTAARLAADKAPYADRSGPLRRAYVSKASGDLLVYRSFVPTAYAKAESVPLVLMLHGGGGNENTFHDMDGGKILQALEQRGYLMVAPRYHRRNQPTHAEDLLQLIALTREQYPKVDPNRIYVTGISMGGYTNAEMLSIKPDLFAAACCVSGTGDPDFSRKFNATPLLILQGGADTVVPPARAEASIKVLKEMNNPHEYHVFPSHGHEYHAEQYIKLTLDYFDRYTGAANKN